MALPSPELLEAIEEEALARDIDPDLLLSIAEQESDFDTETPGSAGEIGAFQVRVVADISRVSV